MAAMAMTHATHAMKSALAGARSTTETSHRARVALANMTGALAMNSAFTMDATAFTVDTLSILRVQRCLVRPMGVAHNPAKVQPVIVRNLAPALASLVHCYDVIEGQTRSIGSQLISEQVRVLQFTPTKSR